ncbi:MAG: isoleucine--tRNA ligase [Planctomycetia bacterium]|nr:isoleucine--tRNA ligase [Planctomycetia bacterium]
MPFAKVETSINFAAQENEILAFWDKMRAFEKLQELRANGPRWSFLDGPITANNPMGVHHAWGRTYKDAFQRYQSMLGKHLRYQNGFDCQGLWVEVEVEKEKKLGSKRDIENLVPGDPFASIDLFVTECKNRVDTFAKKQTEQSIRLGYWMDWDREEDWQKKPDDRRSYFTMAERNNYAIWGFLKKCHDRKLVYHSYDAMPWCPRCGVGLSQMEMAEGYKNVAHNAVFVKFPLRGKPGENLLVWTTTPWTLSSNVGAAVNPKLTYLKVKHKDEILYIAKGALTTARREEDFKRGEWVDGVPKLRPIAQHLKEKGGYEVVGEVLGEQMLGWQYDGPYDHLPAQDHPFGYPEEVARVAEKLKWCPKVSSKAVHKVIPWEDVGETEGTGIVHIAPGCGKEDFGLGKIHGLPPIAPLGEDGIYFEGFGPLTGKAAYEPSTADWVLEDLKTRNLLVSFERYPHSYPHCWRCKTELLFRLVDEWFISMSWRNEIMDVVNRATFLPEQINGKARELDWLKNMGDWMISKKRYWGLALPIWVDEATGEFEVIGSKEELKERAVEGWKDFEGHTPHRPWIDKIKIKSKTTGNLMSRIGDVGNPWLDAGIVPFSTMYYAENKSEWQKWFPADFITECFPGQFKNWFYALLAMSTMLENQPPFKVLLGHGLVRDEKGEEMHKSAGNSIPFEGAAGDGYSIAFRDLKPNESPETAMKTPLPSSALGWEIGEVVHQGKKTQALKAKYPPMGADVMRWLYCRTNPASNINFGPGPADEVRSKVVMKLWNTYAFFVNYARLDGFDPSTPQVPIAERSDLDRWILSDLQLLIQQAHKAFEEYNLPGFVLAAEQFIDDKLSNWYVRRSRRRFWRGKSAGDMDKLSAYQTLYTVLVTLTKLMAPIVPFFTEAMYQNLVLSPLSPGGRGAGGEGAAESVHHCNYPQPDSTLMDETLSKEMDALLRIVSLGSAARNTAKIKVRQPLAELKVQPADEADASAVKRFAEQIKEELNVKRVSLHGSFDNTEKLHLPEGEGILLTMRIKANLKSLGPKAGAKLQEAKIIIESGSAELFAVASGGLDSHTLTIDGLQLIVTKDDMSLTMIGAEGWVGVVDKLTMLAIDTRLTKELKEEGLAREVIRQVQDLRKKSDLQMEDRIALVLQSAAPELNEAIATFKDYIASETLTKEWPAMLPADAFTTEVKAEGMGLTISLKKMN